VYLLFCFNAFSMQEKTNRVIAFCLFMSIAIACCIRNLKAELLFNYQFICKKICLRRIFKTNLSNIYIRVIIVIQVIYICDIFK